MLRNEVQDLKGAMAVLTSKLNDAMDLLSKVPRIIPPHPHSTRLCGAVLLSLRVCMQGASCAVLCTDGTARAGAVFCGARACMARPTAPARFSVHGQTNSAGPLYHRRRL